MRFCRAEPGRGYGEVSRHGSTSNSRWMGKEYDKLQRALQAAQAGMLAFLANRSDPEQRQKRWKRSSAAAAGWWAPWRPSHMEQCRQEGLGA